MDVTADLDAPCDPTALFAWVEDLKDYPAWLEIVPRAEAIDDAPDPAWSVDLRGRLGPLARSKRLRMVRTVHDAPHHVVFEREELDGRSHSAWVLKADVCQVAGGSRLTMHLHYGGSLWGPMLERLLGDEIGQSRATGCWPASQEPSHPPHLVPDTPALGVESPPADGARWDGTATTVAVCSPAAERVELSVITAEPDGAEWRTDMERSAEDMARWRLRTEHLRPGDRYGFRVHGPRADPRLLLLDPAALAVTGELDWAHLDFSNVEGDTGPHVPWSVVVDPAFDWQDDVHPAVAAADRVIYELNVRSFTARLPTIPEAQRGTYAGLGHPSAIEHLTRLGVTTIELLPVQQFVTGRAQWERGQRNLWGYDPVAWFAPHGGYAARDDGAQVAELQATIRALHAAGLEVVLDVVFNHSGEYDRAGPAICFRGIDDAGWYRHHPDGSYEDTTGCRNTIDLRPAPNRALVVACLRSWVEHFHIDGFRFDLATTLLRGDDGVDRDAPFLAAVAADPVLAGRVFIAEPWDAAPGGYHLGGFPEPWSEWNDRFRDDVRDVWRGAPGTRERLATRLAGSSDIFGPARPPTASINFVTAHDGFTLADLVAYEQRRNDANGEGGNDGAADNRSWNCGVEGPTDDPAVLALRRRQQRNLLATLLLARGTPMIVAGDELGRTQGGNNNAYCQDNEVSWLDWERADDGLLDFVTRAIALRRDRPELRGDTWLTDAEVEWRTAAGGRMADTDWWAPDDPLLVMALASLTIAVNPGPEDREVVLPAGEPWRRTLDTAADPGGGESPPAELMVAGGGTVTVPGRSILVHTR